LTCFKQGKAVRRNTVVPSKADRVRQAITVSRRKAEEDKTVFMDHLRKASTIVEAAPFKESELMALDFNRKFMIWVADCRTGKSYGIVYCILREMELGRTVFVILCLKTIEQFEQAVKSFMSMLQSVELDPRVKIYTASKLAEDPNLVKELEDRIKQKIPSIVFSWFFYSHIEALPLNIMAGNTVAVDEGQNKFSFSRNAEGGFSKRVVDAFVKRGGFDSHLRMVSATHLDTLYTINEAAKATGQRVEAPLVLMQDEKKLEGRKFYKLTPQSAALTVKLDGKGFDADSAYGFNIIKGNDKVEYFKKEQFHRLWVDLYDRQVSSTGPVGIIFRMGMGMGFREVTHSSKCHTFLCRAFDKDNPHSIFFGTTMLELGCVYITLERGCLQRGVSVLRAYPHTIVIVDSGMTGRMVLSLGADGMTLVEEPFPKGCKISEVLTTLHLRGAEPTTPVFIITNRGMGGGDDFIQSQGLFDGTMLYDGDDKVQMSITGPEVVGTVLRTISLSQEHMFLGAIEEHQGLFQFYKGEDGKLHAYCIKLDLSNPLENPVDSQDFALDPAQCEHDDIEVCSADVIIGVQAGVFQRPITDLVDISRNHNIQNKEQGKGRTNTVSQYNVMPTVNCVMYESTFDYLMALSDTQKSVLANGLEWASPGTPYLPKQRKLLTQATITHAAEDKKFKREAAKTVARSPAKVPRTEANPSHVPAPAADCAGPSNVHELRLAGVGEVVGPPGRVVLESSMNQELMARLSDKGVYNTGPFGFEAVLAMQAHLASFGLPVVSTLGFRVFGVLVGDLGSRD
jgi:hypothetical protein